MFGRYNQNGTGSYVEDPLERGLGLRCLGICFAIFTLCASFGIGNMVKPILLQMHFFNKLLILKTVFGLKTFGFHLAFGF